jgi:hypothetical protein
MKLTEIRHVSKFKVFKDMLTNHLYGYWRYYHDRSRGRLDKDLISSYLVVFILI